MALTYDDPVEIERLSPDDAGRLRYASTKRPYLMADGSQHPVKVAVHPDPIVQAIVWQKREGETLQAVDRLRSAREGPQKEFFHLCSIPLPDIAVDRLVKWRELAGDPKLARAIKVCDANGWNAIPLCPSVLVHKFGLWRTKEAAKQWLKRAFPAADKECQNANKISIRDLTLLKRYRPRGQKPWSRALILHGADPLSAIAHVLGVPPDILELRPNPASAELEESPPP
jgi:hypothetical protein